MSPPPPPQASEGGGLLRYLNVVVLGAGHHQVMLAGGLGDGQAHHRADVASQLANRLEPVVGRGPAGGGTRIRGDPGLWGLVGEVCPGMSWSGQGTLPPSTQDQGPRYQLPGVPGALEDKGAVFQSRDPSPTADGNRGARGSASPDGRHPQRRPADPPLATPSPPRRHARPLTC